MCTWQELALLEGVLAKGAMHSTLGYYDDTVTLDCGGWKDGILPQQMIKRKKKEKKPALAQ